MIEQPTQRRRRFSACWGSRSRRISTSMPSPSRAARPLCASAADGVRSKHHRLWRQGHHHGQHQIDSGRQRSCGHELGHWMKDRRQRLRLFQAPNEFRVDRQQRRDPSQSLRERSPAAAEHVVPLAKAPLPITLETVISWPAYSG